MEIFKANKNLGRFITGSQSACQPNNLFLCQRMAIPINVKNALNAINILNRINHNLIKKVGTKVPTKN